MLTRPSFFEASQFAFGAALAERWADLHSEARTILDRFLYLQFSNPELYVTRNAGVVGQRGMFYLVMAGMNVGGNRARCPHTCKALSHVPGLVNAAFYFLGPQAHILPHTGLCDRVLRAHLGLICPPDCALRIGTEQRSWVDGELMVFDDTLEHEAWNRSEKWRAVLSFDFFFPATADPGVLDALAEMAITQKPAERAWYAAAGLESPHPLPPAPGPIQAMVDAHGLYFC